MIKVYSQLTLNERELLSILPNAAIAPPVKRDDLYEDITNGIRVIVIIDGRFHQSLSISCGEIMDALRCGLSVYGSSSMGALRAADMHPFGMYGVGEIYEFIKTSDAFRDDFLGQTFDEENDCRSLTTPYVDFYFNLKKLSSKGLISSDAFKKLLKIFEKLHYSQRDWASLRHEILKCRGDQKALLKPAETALLKMGSQKKRDALDLLKTVSNRQRKVAEHNAFLQTPASNGIKRKAP